MIKIANMSYKMQLDHIKTLEDFETHIPKPRQMLWNDHTTKNMTKCGVIEHLLTTGSCYLFVFFFLVCISLLGLQ